MPLRARYDPTADRMRLTLQPADGNARCFWLTRRQWLGWLHSLLALPQPLRAADSSNATQEAKPPKPRHRRMDEDAEPQSLKGIRLRRVGEGLQVMFVAEEGQGVTLTLPLEGVRRIRDLLEQQAERAGWDVAAGLARLNAGAIASAAVGKARKLH